MDGSTVLAGVLFGCVAFAAFRYGRKQARLRAVADHLGSRRQI